MQVLLKSSKQKPFENVRINSTTILFLKKQEKVALQTTAKGESPYFSTFISRISSHHPHLSGCPTHMLDVLPQVHVLKPSRTTWAPDHKPHTTGVCLHWPNLLSVWRESVKTPSTEQENKTVSIYHIIALRMFFQTPKAVEMPGGVSAAALKECYVLPKQFAKNWSDGQQRSTTESLADTLC